MLKSKLKNMAICYFYTEFSLRSWQIKHSVSMCGTNVHTNKFFDSPTQLSVHWHVKRNERNDE